MNNSHLGANRKPLVIGLIGGVASGKSSVAREMQKLGAVVLDADATGHEALKDAAIREQIVRRFGNGVVGADGDIDRRALGDKVFGDSAALKALTDITHPWIRETVKCRLDEHLCLQDVPAVVLDVSLLLESGAYDDVVDVLLFVDAPPDVREERARRSRGWQPGEMEKRQAHQLPLHEKKARADAVIDNAADASAIVPQVEAFWNKYVGNRKS